jgi:DNA-binding response OmpR family regulator
MATKVLVVDSGPLSQAVVKEAFEAAGFEVATAGSAVAALQLAFTFRPDAVVLELALPDLDGVEVCRRLKTGPGGAPLVLTTSRRREGDDRLRSFAVGADEYVPKPFDPRDMVARVQSLLASQQEAVPAPAAPKTGKVFTFFGAKGGTGTTSICVNAAAALARGAQGTGSVVVSDLVLPIGSVGTMIGLGGGDSIASLAAQDPASIDEKLVESHLVSLTQLRFKALRGSANPAEARRMNPAAIEPIFKALRSLGSYVLVDVGGALSRISMPVLQMSDKIVIVMAFSRAALDMTKVCLDFLVAEGISPQRLLLVLNRPGVSVVEDLNRSEIESYLDRPLAFAIPYEGNTFTVAANMGVPLVVKEPDSTAAMVINDLAAQLLNLG